MFSFARNICAIALLLFAVGCGSNRDKTAEVAAAPLNEATLELKRYRAEDLVATADDFLIDENRVEIAPPIDWNRLPRSDKYLVCFTRSDRTGLPRISVTAEPFTSAIFTKVSADNVIEFAKFRQEVLTGGDEKVKLVENVRPLQLGDSYWVRYVRPAAFRNASAERQILETVYEERLYQIELQVVAGTMKDHRDAAYAVAARVRFVDPSVPQVGDVEPVGSPIEEAPKEASSVEKPPAEKAP